MLCRELNNKQKTKLSVMAGFTVFSAGDSCDILTQNCLHVALVQSVLIVLQFACQKQDKKRNMNCFQRMLTL